MTKPGARRIPAWTGILTVALLVILGGTVGALPARAAISAMTAEPSSGLGDGQYVKINLSNLMPNEVMYFRQCTAAWTNLTTDCTPPNIKILGQVDSSGNGSTYFPVYAYGNDQLKNADGTRKIDCDSKHECAIVAVTDQNHTYSARVSFAPSPADCPRQDATTPLGSGSSAATRAMYRWAASVCNPPLSSPVGYATHNEHDAYSDFFNGLTDFGITGLRPPPPPTPGPLTYKLAPMTASAAVLAYRGYAVNPNGTVGPQVTNLTLDINTIARLFMGKIKSFSSETQTNPTFAELNPGVRFPNFVSVTARAEYNSETYLFTSWLSAVAPDVWKPVQSPSPDIFPVTDPALYLKSGEQAAGLNIVDPPLGREKFEEYFNIGLIDSSTAAYYGLPTATIAMPDGSRVNATPDSILKAIDNSVVAPDGALMPRWNNPNAYPMPMVTYMITPTNHIDPVKGDKLARFLRYAVRDGQTSLSFTDGYVGLPANLVQASLAAADLIPVPPAPAPVPTPAPAQAPSETPTGLSPDLSLLPLPSVPRQAPLTARPAAKAAATPAPKGSASPSAPHLEIAGLTRGQGLELVAAAQAEYGLQFLVPGLVGLTLVLIGGGLGLQLWVWWERRRARRMAGRSS